MTDSKHVSEPLAMNKRIRDFLQVIAPPPGTRLWYGGASLFGALRGVTAAQAAFLAPGHDHSIWQLLLHCAYARYAVRRALEGSSKRGPFPRQGSYWAKLPEEINDTTWNADKALLKNEQQQLVLAIRSFDADRLDEHTTQDHTISDLLWGIVMHDMYHVGELNVLKRVYQLTHPLP
jgi:uncharacterized damage-inducible protein DinB